MSNWGKTRCRPGHFVVIRPVWVQGGSAPWFICWFWHYINCLLVCVFTYRPSFLPFFLPSLPCSFLMVSFWLIYILTPLVSDCSSRIAWFCFQAGGRRRRPNLALVFWVHFMSWNILLCMNVCFCYVWFSFLVLSQEIGQEERLQSDLFCVGWDVNQSLCVISCPTPQRWLYGWGCNTCFDWLIYWFGSQRLDYNVYIQTYIQ